MVSGKFPAIECTAMFCGGAAKVSGQLFQPANIQRAAGKCLRQSEARSEASNLLRRGQV